MAEHALAGMAEVLHRATSRFQPGDTVGGYKVLDLVGRGGMGEVYRARDGRLKRDVAIKVLPRAFAADGERLRRFEQEARSAAALNHPNIISVHDMGTADGSPYIVSELLEGQNLREVLRQGAVPARKALDYAIQTAHGLAAAHDVGILHQDPPELTRVTPPVHPAVDQTIRHCLEKNPLERFQSAHDLAFQLRVAAEGLFPKPETALAASFPFRRGWVLSLVITLALV